MWRSRGRSTWARWRGRRTKCPLWQPQGTAAWDFTPNKLFQGPLSASQEQTVFLAYSLRSQIWLHTWACGLGHGRGDRTGSCPKAQGTYRSPQRRRLQGYLTAKFSCLPTLLSVRIKGAYLSFLNCIQRVSACGGKNDCTWYSGIRQEGRVDGAGRKDKEVCWRVAVWWHIKATWRQRKTSHSASRSQALLFWPEQGRVT